MSFPWAEVVRNAVAEYTTPFYLSAWSPVKDALKELEILESNLPIRHWLSFKTHPIGPLIRQWKSTQYGVEVVSEYELLAALAEGFAPEKILVNGVAKHTWLPRHKIYRLRVHFDSVTEVDQLASQAISFNWRVGVRCHVAEEYDPDEPEFSGQFGMAFDEVPIAIKMLKAKGLEAESLHFHLRSNVTSPKSYENALREAREICQNANFYPMYIDLGGGLPVAGEKSLDNSNSAFDLSQFRIILNDIPKYFPEAREIWLENGRFITARSAVLVIHVLDIKERRDSRYLICDGGRTNHALVSDWEAHDLFTLPHRSGPRTLTTVCGPTCMAFDRLIRTQLPKSIEIGDYVVWMNAGAYHVPWETRFSHGLSKVLWCDQNNYVTLSRVEESFINWWSHWR